MLDYNNIEVMCLQLITLRVVSVDNTIAVTKITSIYTCNTDAGIDLVVYNSFGGVSDQWNNY